MPGYWLYLYLINEQSGSRDNIFSLCLLLVEPCVASFVLRSLLREWKKTNVRPGEPKLDSIDNCTILSLRSMNELS